MSKFLTLNIKEKLTEKKETACKNLKYEKVFLFLFQGKFSVVLIQEYKMVEIQQFVS